MTILKIQIKLKIKSNRELITTAKVFLLQKIRIFTSQRMMNENVLSPLLLQQLKEIHAQLVGKPFTEQEKYLFETELLLPTKCPLCKSKFTVKTKNGSHFRHCQSDCDNHYKRINSNTIFTSIRNSYDVFFKEIFDYYQKGKYTNICVPSFFENVRKNALTEIQAGRSFRLYWKLLDPTSGYSILLLPDKAFVFEYWDALDGSNESIPLVEKSISMIKNLRFHSTDVEICTEVDVSSLCERIPGSVKFKAKPHIDEGSDIALRISAFHKAVKNRKHLIRNYLSVEQATMLLNNGHSLAELFKQADSMEKRKKPRPFYSTLCPMFTTPLKKQKITPVLETPDSFKDNLPSGIVPFGLSPDLASDIESDGVSSNVQSDMRVQPGKESSLKVTLPSVQKPNCFHSAIAFFLLAPSFKRYEMLWDFEDTWPVSMLHNGWEADITMFHSLRNNTIMSVQAINFFMSLYRSTYADTEFFFADVLQTHEIMFSRKSGSSIDLGSKHPLKANILFFPFCVSPNVYILIVYRKKSASLEIYDSCPLETNNLGISAALLYIYDLVDADRNEVNPNIHMYMSPAQPENNISTDVGLMMNIHFLVKQNTVPAVSEPEGFKLSLAYVFVSFLAEYIRVLERRNDDYFSSLVEKRY